MLLQSSPGPDPCCVWSRAEKPLSVHLVLISVLACVTVQGLQRCCLLNYELCFLAGITATQDLSLLLNSKLVRKSDGECCLVSLRAKEAMRMSCSSRAGW